MPRPMPATTEDMTTAQRDRVVTPDGVALSGWWRRAIAYWIDSILVAVAVQALLLPFQLATPNALLAPFSNGPDALDDWGAIGSGVWWHGVATIVATVAVTAAYTITMHARLGWTLGKRVTRIRVRNRLQERRPTVAEAALRWSVHWLPSALSTTPWLGGAAGLWTTLDGLWPLWDARRQAIHDKAAKTSVVRG